MRARPLELLTYDLANSIWVDLADGRVITVPLACFPRLLSATPEQRALVTYSSRGLHWEALDEDISVDSLLAGVGEMGREQRAAA